MKEDESPSKPVTKATVCLVDLSRRDDSSEEIKLRNSNIEEEEELLGSCEENEGSDD
jgi:hypothetical protein